jgi:hypothetical protein
MEGIYMLELIQKYLDGTASEEEEKLVDDWYDSMEGNGGLTESLDPATILEMQHSSFQRIRHFKE